MKIHIVKENLTEYLVFPVINQDSKSESYEISTELWHKYEEIEAAYAEMQQELYDLIGSKAKAA